MERLNWHDIISARVTPKMVAYIRDYISMEGALDIVIPKGKPLPKKLYSMTADIEAKMREAYPGLNVIGEESADEISQEYPGCRYWGQICAGTNSGIVARIGMSGSETIPQLKMDTMLTFSGIFPLGDYKEQTGKALQGIWHHIKGFSYLIPTAESRISPDKQGDQFILLVMGGDPVASGKYAIKDSGLPVKPKESILMSGGVNI